jgi:hypothetical protein
MSRAGWTRRYLYLRAELRALLRAFEGFQELTKASRVLLFRVFIVTASPDTTAASPTRKGGKTKIWYCDFTLPPLRTIDLYEREETGDIWNGRSIDEKAGSREKGGENKMEKASLLKIPLPLHL